MRRMYSENQVLKTIESQAQEHGLKVFENIVDKNGNHRFIEGEGGLVNTIEGVNITYCKWSLSGSHIMFVVAGTIANATALANADFKISYPIPQWLLDKIYAVYADIYLEMKATLTYNDDYSTQTITFALVKREDLSPKCMRIQNAGGFTASKDRAFRVQFDLLIDNE